MGETVTVQCPYCGEDAEVDVEPDEDGVMVQDCDVCCHPWRVSVHWHEGEPVVDVERDA